MRFVIFEDAGVVIGDGDLAPVRRRMLTNLIESLHCLEHGEPSGVACVDVKTLQLSVDSACCPMYLARLARVFG